MRMDTESLLRIGRLTSHLPWLRGVSVLARVYKKTLPASRDWRLRVDDFDGDIKMDVDPREFIGVSIWHKPDLYEKAERELFCSHVSRGSVVLDVGANIGIYSLLAAKRGARVFAIEADSKNAEMLRRNVQLNDMAEPITITEMAATECPKTVILFRNPDNCGGSSMFAGVDGVEVQGRTVDSLDLPPIDVCKMDIEGSEVFALRGMEDTIRRSRNMKLLVEHAEEHGNSPELFDFLRSHFQSIAVVGGPVLRRDERPPKHCNLWATEPYGGGR